MREIIDRLLILEDHISKREWSFATVIDDIETLFEITDKLKPLLLRMKALEDLADAVRGLSYVNSEGDTTWSVNAHDYYNLYCLVKKLDESGK